MDVWTQDRPVPGDIMVQGYQGGNLITNLLPQPLTALEGPEKS